MARTKVRGLISQQYEYLIHVHVAMVRQARQKTSCIQGKRQKTGVGSASVTRLVSPNVLRVSGAA
jgi:hypothetical protein